MTKTVSGKALAVTILSPDHAPVSATADAVSLKNGVGPLSILPGHANFVSTIEEYVILHHGRRQKKIAIGRGLVYIRSDKVKIFVVLPVAVAAKAGLPSASPSTS